MAQPPPDIMPEGLISKELSRPLFLSQTQSTGVPGSKQMAEGDADGEASINPK
jgi:hypothetical protein